MENSKEVICVQKKNYIISSAIYVKNGGPSEMHQKTK